MFLVFRISDNKAFYGTCQDVSISLLILGLLRILLFVETISDYLINCWQYYEILYIYA